MGMVRKNAAQLALMRESGKLLCHVLDQVEAAVQPGVSTGDLNRLAESLIEGAGARASFKGLYGFPAALCTSVNEAVVHGIPRDDQVLQEGDLISVDCGVFLGGYHADSARTIGVGQVSGEAQRLMQVTRDSLEAAIAQCKPGARLSNLGATVEKIVRKAGFSVLRDYAGHGIGQELHEDPEVLNYGRPGRGPRLLPGLVLAIEPMVAVGSGQCETLGDEWTVVTRDRKLSAHFEHTVAITEDGPWVLTRGT